VRWCVRGFAVGGLVDSQRSGGDDVHVEVFEFASRSGADALEPSAYDMQGVLGRVQQHPPRRRTGKRAQAGVPEATRRPSPRRGRTCSIWARRQRSRRPVRPKSVTSQRCSSARSDETIGLLDGQPAHRRRPATLAASVRRGKELEEQLLVDLRGFACAARASSSPPCSSRSQVPWA